MLGSATAALTFHDFLDRMRNPEAADLVRSIKSFIVTFVDKAPNAESDSTSVHAFITNTEQTFREHPLWAGASEEELDSAGEGLEKYLMTKLFPRAFAPLPEDVARDERLSAKLAALQQFVRPEHLDIPSHHYNEASWLLAQKELQKMGSFKAPRDKLVCLLNCCRVINNLLLNAHMREGDGASPGADDFLPVLIYVLLKANPPQLLANVEYIQRYRHPSRLVGEAAYFYTNVVSAATFLEHLEASSLTMAPEEFEASLKHAIAAIAHSSAPPPSSPSTPAPAPSPPMASLQERNGPESNELSTEDIKRKRLQLGHELESALLSYYTFVFSKAEDLRVGDVEVLLNQYKELVLNYTTLCRSIANQSAPARQAEEASAVGVREVAPQAMESRDADRQGEEVEAVNEAVNEASLFEGLSMGMGGAEEYVENDGGVGAGQGRAEEEEEKTGGSEMESISKELEGSEDGSGVSGDGEETEHGEQGEEKSVEVSEEDLTEQIKPPDTASEDKLIDKEMTDA